MKIRLALFLTTPAQIPDADFFSSHHLENSLILCVAMCSREKDFIYSTSYLHDRNLTIRLLTAPQYDSPQKANKICFKGTSYLSLLCDFLYSLACNIAALLSTDQLWLKDRSVACPPWQQPTAYGEKASQEKAWMFIPSAQTVCSPIGLTSC